MTDVFIFGGLTAAAVLIVFLKIGILKILGYDILVDIAATVALAYLFQGTVSGVLSAVIAGLIISIALLVLKAFMGYEKVIIKGHRIKWQRYK